VGNRKTGNQNQPRSFVLAFSGPFGPIPLDIAIHSRPGEVVASFGRRSQANATGAKIYEESNMPRSIIKTIRNLLFALVLPGFVLAGPVDLNTADADTIALELNGVGVSRAQAIVEYRNEYGPFLSVDDLLNVAGIGRHIVNVNRENILLEKAP
jgi:competence protein ComEA